MNERIVLVGAGSAVFTRGLLADMIRQKWEGSVALVDTDTRALAVAEKLAGKMLALSGSPLRLSAHTDCREALPGATAVICTIGVGGRRAWEKDVFVPREHGIFQPVGDTVMPGGSSRALRMIPAMVAIAQSVLEIAPQALFFNYGNPMSAVCRGVRKATGASMVGLCHGVPGVAHYLADALGVQVGRLGYAALGINHLTWFTSIRIDGTDALPRLRAIARERLAQMPAVDEPFTWEVTDLFGAFPAVLDRHVTEFFPHLFSRKNAYYGRTLGVDAFSFEATIEWGDRAFSEMAETAMSPAPLTPDFLQHLSGEHEQVVDIIECIRRDSGRIFWANLPNAGQVPNLPAEAVIECPAVADARGIRPIFAGPLAPALAGTLATRFQWVETVVEAALEGSREKFAGALLIDGSVASVPQARKLADELIDAQIAYLPQFAAKA
jgi:alpha-galactosidase